MQIGSIALNVNEREALADFMVGIVVDLPDAATYEHQKCEVYRKKSPCDWPAITYEDEAEATVSKASSYYERLTYVKTAIVIFGETFRVWKLVTIEG